MFMPIIPPIGKPKIKDFSHVANLTTGYETSTSKTWSGVSIGAAAPGRRLIIAIAHVDVIGTYGGDAPWTSVVLGGVTATRLGGKGYHVGGSSYGYHCDLYYADIDSGTTADLTLSMSSGNYNEIRVSIFRGFSIADVLAEPIAYQSKTPPTDNLSVNVAVPAGGGVIGIFAGSDNGPSARTGAIAYRMFDNAVASHNVQANKSGQGRNWVGLDEVYDHASNSNSEPKAHMVVFVLKGK